MKKLFGLGVVAALGASLAYLVKKLEENISSEDNEEVVIQTVKKEEDE